MGNELSDTQGQQTDAGNPGQSTEENVEAQQGNAENMIPQSRFDEVTKRMRDEERARKAAEAQNAELLRALTARVTEIQQPQQREQAPEFEPEERKKLDYLLNPLKQEIVQLRGALYSSTAAQEVASVANSKTPPEVVQEAARVLAGWRQQGGRGNPKDALAFAMGNYILGKGSEEQEVNQQRQDFNRGARTVQTGQGSGASQNSGKRQMSEAEIERLSPEAQAAYYSERLGDTPFDD